MRLFATYCFKAAQIALCSLVFSLSGCSEQAVEPEIVTVPAKKVTYAEDVFDHPGFQSLANFCLRLFDQPNGINNNFIENAALNAGLIQGFLWQPIHAPDTNHNFFIGDRERGAEIGVSIYEKGKITRRLYNSCSVELLAWGPARFEHGPSAEQLGAWLEGLALGWSLVKQSSRISHDIEQITALYCNTTFNQDMGDLSLMYSFIEGVRTSVVILDSDDANCSRAKAKWFSVVE